MPLGFQWYALTFSACTTVSVCSPIPALGATAEKMGKKSPATQQRTEVVDLFSFNRFQQFFVVRNVTVKGVARHNRTPRVGSRTSVCSPLSALGATAAKVEKKSESCEKKNSEGSTVPSILSYWSLSLWFRCSCALFKRSRKKQTRTSPPENII